MKIEYDINNKKHQEILNDYYFIRYFVKSLKFDWKQFYNNATDKQYAKQIIINHQNKCELKRFNELCLFYFSNTFDNYDCEGNKLEINFAINFLIDRFHIMKCLKWEIKKAIENKSHKYNKYIFSKTT